MNLSRSLPVPLPSFFCKFLPVSCMHFECEIITSVPVTTQLWCSAPPGANGEGRNAVREWGAGDFHPEAKCRTLHRAFQPLPLCSPVWLLCCGCCVSAGLAGAHGSGEGASSREEKLSVGPGACHGVGGGQICGAVALETGSVCRHLQRRDGDDDPQAW